MFRLYLKTALRNLLRNPFFTFINLFGLVCGLTCCLLMLLYLVHELSYDKFQPNAPHLVRVAIEYKFSDGEPEKTNVSSARTLPALRARFAEIRSGVRLYQSTRTVKYGPTLMLEKRFLMADSTFFQVFNGFQWIQGNAAKALNAPQTVVITQSMAEKYFKGENPIGKSLLITTNQTPYQVTGVVADPPTNSQIKFDFIGNIGSMKDWEGSWWNANYLTYFLLHPQTDLQQLEQKTNQFLKEEMASQPGVSLKITYEPFLDIHLRSPFDGLEPAANIQYIYLTVLVAILMLAIAAFTYINLSTARSLERAKEIGIRKTVGARREQVFLQFMGESFLLSFLAFMVSLGLAVLLLPWFNQLADKQLAVSQLFQPVFVLISLAVMSALALLAGLYPAFIVAGFEPNRVLKGAFKNKGSGLLLRKSLMVFQFAISGFLLFSTLGIHDQFSFIQEKSLGYEKENILALSMDPKLMEHPDVVKTELKGHPAIISASMAYESPVDIQGGYGVFKELGPQAKSWAVTANPIDEDFVPTTGLKIIAGENLRKADVEAVNENDTLPDAFAFLMNEACCHMLGWNPDEAIGKTIYLGEHRPGKVKGVVKDFHFASLHQSIAPLILFPGGYRPTLMLKIGPGSISAVVPFLEKKLKALAPNRPFEYRLLEDDFQKLYATEKRTQQVFNLFSALAMILACLGLLGLSVYAANQRIKEMGIRKVMGATVIQIVALLTRQFLVLISLAALLSIPFSIWFLHHWFSDFAYRVEMQPVWFLAGLSALVFVSFLTMAFQALRTAWENPAKHLRTE